MFDAFSPKKGEASDIPLAGAGLGSSSAGFTPLLDAGRGAAGGRAAGAGLMEGKGPDAGAAGRGVPNEGRAAFCGLPSAAAEGPSAISVSPLGVIPAWGEGARLSFFAEGGGAPVGPLEGRLVGAGVGATGAGAGAGAGVGATGAGACMMVDFAVMGAEAGAGVDPMFSCGGEAIMAVVLGAAPAMVRPSRNPLVICPTSGPVRWGMGERAASETAGAATAAGAGAAAGAATGAGAGVAPPAGTRLMLGSGARVVGF